MKEGAIVNIADTGGVNLWLAIRLRRVEGGADRAPRARHGALIR
jgi:hypothetical protein